MRVSYNWLQNYFEQKLPSPADIAKGLTMHSFEIESVEQVGGGFDNVVIGKVLKKEKHPNADRLNVCVVDVGDGGRTIVCGAANVAEGQTVAVALPGAVLPGDFGIKVSKIRGVESNGMICSEKELGFVKESPNATAEAVQGQATGIWEIKEDLKVGTPLKNFLKIETDYVFDIKVLPDRAHDCLSHEGIAVEIGAIFNIPIKKRDRELSVRAIYSVKIKLPINEIVKRYDGIIIRNVQIKESPDWLKARLRALGQKPINNIVDITNYVMLDSGQPLHAFDLAKLEKKDNVYSIEVRQAKKNEKMTALDDLEYHLPENSILITDGNSKEILGIAGIKGGKASAINSNTKDVLIEAANFDPVLTRITSQTLKLRTESSIRFEKEISSVLIKVALSKAIRMINDLGAGEVIGISEVYPKPEKPRIIEVKKDDISKILGIEISQEEVKSILESLDCTVSIFGNIFSVQVPLCRLDLTIKENIVEEVGRIYGYDKILSVPLPESDIKPKINKLFYYTSKISEILVKEGFSEIKTYSFRNKGRIEVQNPIALDKSFLRENLSDGVREGFKQNIYNAPLLGLDFLRVFEVGTVFGADSEHVSLCIAIKGAGKKIKVNDEIKAIVALLEKEIGLTGFKEVEEGVIELDLEKAVAKMPVPEKYDFGFHDVSKSYKTISNYPFVLRDIALWVDGGVSEEEIHSLIIKNGGKLLVRVDLFDVFKKDNKISYAFRLVFQSQEKTLSDEEVNKVMENITNEVVKKGWTVR